MKFTYTLMMLFVAAFFISCSNNSTNNNASTAPPISPAVTPNTSVAVGSVQHYTCPNNCAGSGGAEAGTCPVCGTAYAHNQAFHDQQGADATTIPPPTTTITPNTSVAVGGVQHYTCPNNCAGSGGDAAGTCPVCGTAYAHNQAFHDQGAGGVAPATVNPAISTMKGPQAQPSAQTPQVQAVTPQMPQAPAPAQNAAGVYHYACTKSGCGGGAGSAGACPKCGTALAHNQAYHQ